MIVFSIAALILVVVFLAVPQLQRKQRDDQRIQYVNRAFAALLEFARNNDGQFPVCDSGAGGIPCTADNKDGVDTFIKKYLPAGTDPSTGNSWTASSLPPPGNGEFHTTSKSTMFYYDAFYVAHSKKPTLGQILIETGHWCYSTKPDDGPKTNPIASLSVSGLDLQLNKIVMLIGLDGGKWYCIDNYYG